MKHKYKQLLFNTQVPKETSLGGGKENNITTISRIARHR